MIRWVFRTVMDPAYDGLDLRGADGRVSLKKLAYVAGLVVGLAIWVRLAMKTEGDPGWGFLGYSLLVMTYAVSRSAFITLETAIIAKWGGQEGIKARLSGAQPRPPEG